MRKPARAAVALLLLACAPAAGLCFSGPGASPPPDPSVRSPEEESAGEIAGADAHYARRDAGHAGPRADPLEIAAAIAGYEKAAAQSPGSAEARWKLARALYFFGTYTDADPKTRLASYERARRAGEDAIAVVARRRSRASPVRELDPAAAAALVSGDPDAPPAWFWTAVGWGQWALASGRVAAARRGAASRIRDDCATLIRLDPLYEEGGGYRILGRLHDQAPKIPFLTGWVSRDEAIRNLRAAVAAAPANLVNLHFLGEALAHRGERAEAERLETDVARASPSAGHLVEELAIQESARKNLEAWKSKD
ncbi:MAG: hypothetical protein ABI592_07730 [Acidobacteriota bacterium]